MKTQNNSSNKGYLFKFKDETFEHLQIKKVSLNLKSSLLNQYFPIAFQFSIGSLMINNFYSSTNSVVIKDRERDV
jgi:hypothetical protein